MFKIFKFFKYYIKKIYIMDNIKQSEYFSFQNKENDIPQSDIELNLKLKNETFLEKIEKKIKKIEIRKQNDNNFNPEKNIIINEYTQQINSLEKTYSKTLNLQQQLDEYKELINNFEKKINNLVDQNQNLIQEKENLIKEIEFLNQENFNIVDKFENIKKTNDKLEKKIVELIQINEKINKNNQILEEKMMKIVKEEDKKIEINEIKYEQYEKIMKLQLQTKLIDLEKSLTLEINQLKEVFYF